jgi:outer membrane murein-binding lipoprotein Lpp
MSELSAVESFLNDVVTKLNQTALTVQRLEAEVAALKAMAKKIAPAYYADYRPDLLSPFTD